MQYSSEGGQALTWLGFFRSIGIGRARVIFPAGSETSSLCIQKKNNYISVIALSLKTAAIEFYPDLSGLPRCLAVLLRRRTSVDVTGFFLIYRNRKSSSDFSCRFWNPVLVYTKKEQLHFCNCSFIKNGGYRILSRFIGTPTLLNSVIICWNCFVYTLFDNTHTKKEQLHFCNCSFIKNGGYLLSHVVLQYHRRNWA